VKHNAVKQSTKLIISFNSKRYCPSGILIHRQHLYAPHSRRCTGCREPVNKGKNSPVFANFTASQLNKNLHYQLPCQNHGCYISPQISFMKIRKQIITEIINMTKFIFHCYAHGYRSGFFALSVTIRIYPSLLLTLFLTLYLPSPTHYQ
jgi:hypothetical protein